MNRHLTRFKPLSHFRKSFVAGARARPEGQRGKHRGRGGKSRRAPGDAPVWGSRGRLHRHGPLMGYYQFTSLRRGLCGSPALPARGRAPGAPHGPGPARLMAAAPPPALSGRGEEPLPAAPASGPGRGIAPRLPTAALSAGFSRPIAVCESPHISIT